MTSLPAQVDDGAARRRPEPAGAEAQELAYWALHLRGAPPALELPCDRPRPPELRAHGGRHAFELAAALGCAMRASAARCGVTPFALLLASFQALLFRLSGQGDVVVGTSAAGEAGLLPLR